MDKENNYNDINKELKEYKKHYQNEVLLNKNMENKLSKIQ